MPKKQSPKKEYEKSLEELNGLVDDFSTRIEEIAKMRTTIRRKLTNLNKKIAQEIKVQDKEKAKEAAKKAKAKAK